MNRRTFNTIGLSGIALTALSKFKLISEVIFFIIIANLIYAIAGFFTLFGFRSKVERILYRRSR